VDPGQDDGSCRRPNSPVDAVSAVVPSYVHGIDYGTIMAGRR
jgi:hypothetical protein